MKPPGQEDSALLLGTFLRIRMSLAGRRPNFSNCLGQSFSELSATGFILPWRHCFPDGLVESFNVKELFREIFGIDTVSFVATLPVISLAILPTVKCCFATMAPFQRTWKEVNQNKQLTNMGKRKMPSKSPGSHLCNLLGHCSIPGALGLPMAVLRQPWQ